MLEDCATERCAKAGAPVA